MAKATTEGECWSSLGELKLDATDVESVGW
jgi:hypothetical protein